MTFVPGCRVCSPVRCDCSPIAPARDQDDLQRVADELLSPRPAPQWRRDRGDDGCDDEARS